MTFEDFVLGIIAKRFPFVMTPIKVVIVTGTAGGSIQARNENETQPLNANFSYLTSYTPAIGDRCVAINVKKPFILGKLTP